MDLKKNYAEVLIDGKIYTLGGVEEASYFQQVAAYVNHKLGELRRQPGFSKQKEDYQLVMLEINMADDYFKAREEADMLRRQTEETERDIYGIKHELINTQMKLETAQSRIRELEDALERAALAGASRREEEHRRSRQTEGSSEETVSTRRIRRNTSGLANRSQTTDAPPSDQEDDRRHLAEYTQDERVAEEQTAAAAAVAAAVDAVVPDAAVKNSEEPVIETAEESAAELAEEAVAEPEETSEITGDELAESSETVSEEPIESSETVSEEPIESSEGDGEKPTEELPVSEQPETESAADTPVQKQAEILDQEAGEKARKAKEEEEKQKALAAARVATEQLLKSRALQMQNHLQNRGHQNKKK